MKRIYLLFTLLCWSGCLAGCFAQGELYNEGDVIFLQNGALLYVDGEVINTDQGALTGTIENRGELQLTGNFSNTSVTSNVFQSGDPGLTNFVGNNAVQTVGGTRDTYFNNISLSKPGGVRELRLLRDARADGILDINDDFLNTQTFTFWVTNTATNAVQRAGDIVPPYINSNIQGYVASDGAGRLARSTINGNTYFYPVGTATRFRPVEIVAAFPTDYGVRFVNTPTPGGTLDPTISLLNPNWYHKLYKTGASGSGETIIIYSDFDGDGLCDPGGVIIAERNAANHWEDLNPTVTTTQLATPFLSSTTKTGYPTGTATPWVTEDFALAGLFVAPGFTGCTFPIEMLYLEAHPLSASILLDWATLTESQNAGFEVLRSENGFDFEYIGWVDGAGNSQTEQQYLFEDTQVKKNQTYYYQLHQLDYNGQETETEIVRARIRDEEAQPFGEFYPNPTSGSTHLWVVSDTESEMTFAFFNALGQKVQEDQHRIVPGTQVLDFELEKHAKGAYLVRITQGLDIWSKKIVLK